MLKTIRSTSNAWVTFPRPNSLANMRLFCFPHAGGGAHIFRSWANSLPATLEVCPVELPGRGTRLSEIPFTRIEPLVEAIAIALLPYLDKPFAFFGHSMGATLSFELARFLRRKYGLLPAHLFVAARPAPQIPDSDLPIHALPDPAFIEELRSLSGTPEAALENAELMQLLLPILRADFAVVETYVYAEEPPLACPITAFGGTSDRECSCDDLEAWREQTNEYFSVQLFQGNHFFIQSAQSLLLQALSRELRQFTNGMR